MPEAALSSVNRIQNIQQFSSKRPEAIAAAVLAIQHPAGTREAAPDETPAARSQSPAAAKDQPTAEQAAMVQILKTQIQGRLAQSQAQTVSQAIGKELQDELEDGFYTVKAGDQLGKILAALPEVIQKKYQVTVQDPAALSKIIIEANREVLNSENLDFIKIGTDLDLTKALEGLGVHLQPTADGATTEAPQSPQRPEGSSTNTPETLPTTGTEATTTPADSTTEEEDLPEVKKTVRRPPLVTVPPGEQTPLRETEHRDSTESTSQTAAEPSTTTPAGPANFTNPLAGYRNEDLTAILQLEEIRPDAAGHPAPQALLGDNQIYAVRELIHRARTGDIEKGTAKAQLESYFSRLSDANYDAFTSHYTALTGANFQRGCEIVFGEDYPETLEGKLKDIMTIAKDFNVRLNNQPQAQAKALRDLVDSLAAVEVEPADAEAAKQQVAGVFTRMKADPKNVAYFEQVYQSENPGHTLREDLKKVGWEGIY